MVIAEYNFTQQERELLKKKKILLYAFKTIVLFPIISIPVSTSQTGAVRFLFMLPLQNIEFGSLDI